LASDGVVLSITNWLVWWNVEKSQWHAHVGGLWTHVANNKKQKRNQNENEDNYNFCWQGE